MATYVLGDIHGQFEALGRLFARLDLDLDNDLLWLVGDLVNRGPRSLEVLRWARRLDERLGGRMVTVLGNHDLRLLAFGAGIDRPRPRDTLDEVLAAPDHEELLGWLRRRPLLHRRGNDLLVHAGLLPEWTAEEARTRARETEEALRGGDAERLLGDWRAKKSVADPVRERRRHCLAVLTGIRTCTPGGELCDWSGPPEGAPSGCVPWFRSAARCSAEMRIVFGHWAALGLHLEPRIKALDSGAAWGGRLTALRLDDGELFQEAVKPAPTRPGASSSRAEWSA